MRPQPSTRARAATHAAAFIPRGRWQLDEACGICGRGFGVLRGRHHCRHCGMSVCARHSRNREVVPSSLSPLRQRVCDQCFPACQRGVTRPRRRTVGARTFSVRFDGEDGDSKKTGADSVSATTTTTATTMCTSTTISSSEPVTPLYSPKPRKPASRQQRAPRSPREHLAMTLRAAAEAATPATEQTTTTASGPSGRLQQRQQQRQLQQQHQQQQAALPPPQLQRRRASTSDSRPQARRRYADSAVSSSSGSCSFSSLDDHSSSSSDDDSSSDDEELIAKYLRRGAPLRSLGSATTSRSIASGSILGRHDSPLLEAIEEKKSLDGPSSPRSSRSSEDLYGAATHALRSLANRKSSSANTVTEEEEEEEEEESTTIRDDAIGSSSSSSSNEYDDKFQEQQQQEQQGDDSGGDDDDDDDDDSDGEVIVSEPGTPPTRLNLQAVALAYSAAVKAAAERKRLPGDRERKQVLPLIVGAAAAAKPKSSGAAPPYQITEQERRVMQEIAALELEIQKHQSELPELLERLQQTERTAARLREEARESQLRVQQYRKAQSVVTRSVRNAKVLMREREFQAAILELLRASGIDRASAAVWHLLAECRLEISQLDAAEHACRKSLRLRQQQQSVPRDVRPSVALLGRILHAQGRQDEAIECYLTALER